MRFVLHLPAALLLVEEDAGRHKDGTADGERLADESRAADSGRGLEQFANLIEMDRSYYASIEVGRRNVSLSNLKKIADGFQITISELMRGIE